MNGIFISIPAFNALSQGARMEVLAGIGLSVSGLDEPILATANGARPAVVTSSEIEGPVELTVAMVRKLTSKLSDKTLAALKVIAGSDSPQFHMKDVLAAIPDAKSYMDLRGVWSALTRRTRNIMDDGEVDLIWWADTGIHDEAENYVDHIGEVSPLTYQSLRTHFGIR